MAPHFEHCFFLSAPHNGYAGRFSGLLGSALTVNIHLATFLVTGMGYIVGGPNDP